MIPRQKWHTICRTKDQISYYFFSTYKYYYVVQLHCGSFSVLFCVLLNCLLHLTLQSSAK